MDDVFRTLGFERWTSQLPLQTTMYVHAHAARDGARLFLAVPPVAATDSAEAYEQLAATVERFFRRHGGREAAPAVARLSALLA